MNVGIGFIACVSYSLHVWILDSTYLWRGLLSSGVQKEEQAPRCAEGHERLFGGRTHAL